MSNETKITIACLAIISAGLLLGASYAHAGGSNFVMTPAIPYEDDPITFNFDVDGNGTSGTYLCAQVFDGSIPFGTPVSLTSNPQNVEFEDFLSADSYTGVAFYEHSNVNCVDGYVAERYFNGTDFNVLEGSAPVEETGSTTPMTDGDVADTLFNGFALFLIGMWTVVWFFKRS